MLFSILFIFISLFFVAFIVLHVQIFTFQSKFVNAIANVLLIIGVYTLLITSFKSIFLVPLCGTIIAGFYINKKGVRFDFFQWKSTLTITSFVSLFFLILYFRNNELLIPSEDYLFWIRLGLSNQRFGVENMNTFYNLLDSSYNKADLYHHLEFWLMNVGSLLNRQDASLNLFFFTYPLGVIIGSIGIKELIINSYPELLKKQMFVHFSVFFFIVGFLFFVQPWDAFNHYLGLNNLPISGMGFVWRGLKTIYVLNIVVALFLYIRTPNFENLIGLSLVSFFYIPVLPIVMVTVFIWMLYVHFYMHKVAISNYLIVIGLSLGTVFFYMFFANRGGTTVSNFSITEWLTINAWVKFMPAIIMKMFVIPILGFFPFYFMILKNRKSLISSKEGHFLVLLYIVCFGVWCLFVNNVDANQAFLLLFGASLPMILLFVIWKIIFFRKKLVMGFLLIVLYMVPGVIDAINFKSPIKKESVTTIQYVKQLNHVRLLYVPKKAELNSVYDYNERVYTGVNHFILYNTNIDLFSVSAALKGDDKKMNTSTLRMYNFYKHNSPYYKQCGYVDVSSPCFVDFLKKAKINSICTPKIKLNIKGWSKNFENLDYYFYGTQQ